MALPKFPPQAALPPLPLPTSLVSLACALGLKQAPGSTQGLGLQTPALVSSSSRSAGAYPGEMDQRPRTFLSSQCHPPIVFLPVQVGREKKLQHSPAFELLKC